MTRWTEELNFHVYHCSSTYPFVVVVSCRPTEPTLFVSGDVTILAVEQGSSWEESTAFRGINDALTTYGRVILAFWSDDDGTSFVQHLEDCLVS